MWTYTKFMYYTIEFSWILNLHKNQKLRFFFRTFHGWTTFELLSSPWRKRYQMELAVGVLNPSIAVSGSLKRWDRWHMYNPLIGRRNIPLIYTTYSPCLLGGGYMLPTFFEGTITKTLRYLKSRYWTLFRLFWRWFFPYISRIHTAYIGEDSSILGTNEMFGETRNNHRPLVVVLVVSLPRHYGWRMDGLPGRCVGSKWWLLEVP